MDFEFSTYYKSLTPTHRIDEEYIINKAVEEGIIPIELRYGIMQGSYRGVVKSSNDLLFYFTYVPSNDAFVLVKADNPDKVYDATKMFSKCKLGCSMIKAGVAGGSATGSQIGGIDVVDEDDAIAQQQDLITDKHPAAAMISTPDRPDRGKMWHEQEVPPLAKSWDASSLLNDLNANLRKSTEQLRKPVSQKEHDFMIEVMGKTPGQIDRGDTYMSPSHKVLFQQWLGKSMRSKVSSLSDWLKK